jgi:hypothetical protein
MKSQNIRPLLIGLALGAGTILLLGQRSADSNSQIGRYQMVAAGAAPWVVDTTTGEVRQYRGFGIPFEKMGSD